MNTYRIAALVLGSVLFFPVSCTTSLAIGAHIIARLDARDVSRGDKPHQLAYLVAAMPDASLRAVALSELGDFKYRNPQASFLLPKRTGKFAVDKRSSISYVVTSARPETQLVEVTLSGDPATFLRYEAARNIIKPLYSRLWYHGYMFGAFPYAVIIGIALYLIGIRMRKRIQRAPKA